MKLTAYTLAASMIATPVVAASCDTMTNNSIQLKLSDPETNLPFLASHVASIIDTKKENVCFHFYGSETFGTVVKPDNLCVSVKDGDKEPPSVKVVFPTGIVVNINDLYTSDNLRPLFKGALAACQDSSQGGEPKAPVKFPVIPGATFKRLNL